MSRLTGKELSERAAAARAAKRKAEQPSAPITLAPDINEFSGASGNTFGPGGTFFNPQNVFDPRISIGAPFPPEVN